MVAVTSEIEFSAAAIASDEDFYRAMPGGMKGDAKGVLAGDLGD